MPVFVFTDIEGSTRHWIQHQQAMAEVLNKHNNLLRETIHRFGGQVIEFTGDGIYAVFETGRPLTAALEIQKQVASEDWGPIKEFRLRIGLNASTPDREGIDYFHQGTKYFGLAVSHTFRIMSAGSGGQILVTPAVFNFDKVPESAALEDLGLHMLRSLTQPQKIYNLSHPDIPWKNFPAINTLSTRPNNLPSQTTPFVARQNEVHQAAETLRSEECRLLTLYGPGGVGKTRLAIQTAAELITEFREGVYFIPLDPVNSPAYMVSNIAAVLNFPFHGSENQKLQLLNYLRQKQLLLVMDNFEHLLDGVGLMADILEAAPKVKILSTCRERLNFAGEKVQRVQGFEVPDSEKIEGLETYGVIQLFLNAVRRTQPEFMMSPDQAPAIVRICKLVAGMPLGVELAAAWVRIYSCEEIADKIEQNLNFLVSHRPDVPDRHRALYAVCDYFWEQLSEGERAVLRKLSIFRGGFHSQAAWQVAKASTFFLSALMDRAFLRKVTINTTVRDDISNQAEAWRVRYEMHAVLRQYSAEKLAIHKREWQQTQQRHGRYYAAFLNHREERLRGNEQQAALEQIVAEIDNIRLAWDWAIDGAHAEAVEQSFGALFQAYQLENWIDDGAAAFERAFDRFKYLGPEYNQLVGKLLLKQARFISQSAHFEKAKALVEESLLLIKELALPAETAFAHQIYGTVARMRGTLEEALSNFEKSLAIYRDVGNPWFIAQTLAKISDCVYRMGDFEMARKVHWECYNLHRRIGDPRGMAFSLSGLGILLNKLGEPENGETLLRESENLYRAINDRQGLAISIHNLGYIAFARRDYRTARPYFEESLLLFQEMNNHYGVAAAMSALGISSYELGDVLQAKEYLLKAIELTNSMGVLSVLLESLVHTAVIANDSGQPELAVELLAFCLAHAALDKAETEGTALNIWEVVIDRLSSETIEIARQEGEQKTLAEAVAEATIILSEQGENRYYDLDRFSNRISQ